MFICVVCSTTFHAQIPCQGPFTAHKTRTPYFRRCFSRFDWRREHWTCHEKKIFFWLKHFSTITKRSVFGVLSVVGNLSFYTWCLQGTPSHVQAKYMKKKKASKNTIKYEWREQKITGKMSEMIKMSVVLIQLRSASFSSFQSFDVTLQSLLNRFRLT